MSKLDNYIFLSICEKSLEIFNNSHFLTYNGFCRTLKASIEIENLNHVDFYIIDTINEYLQTIYSLTPEDSYNYIIDFFLKEKYINLEYATKLLFEFFKNSFN